MRDGVQLLNNLLETSPIRPVTPVGQLLFNEQKRATENAIFHKLSPQAALRDADETVQRQLDRALRPPRGPLVPWRYFIAVYLGLIVLCALAVYGWETRPRHGEAAALEGGRSRYFRSQWRGGWLCASPWIIGFIVLTGGPILFSIVISFCDFDILNPARFVGLANYRWMFAGDPLFWKAAGNTAFMILGIPLGMALSLGIIATPRRGPCLSPITNGSWTPGRNTGRMIARRKAKPGPPSNSLVPARRRRLTNLRSRSSLPAAANSAPGGSRCSGITG